MLGHECIRFGLQPRIPKVPKLDLLLVATLILESHLKSHYRKHLVHGKACVQLYPCGPRLSAVAKLSPLSRCECMCDLLSANDGMFVTPIPLKVPQTQSKVICSSHRF